jgi:outer membrane protein OmpA-like peptidoglycan-associated protein
LTYLGEHFVRRSLLCLPLLLCTSLHAQESSKPEITRFDDSEPKAEDWVKALEMPPPLPTRGTGPQKPPTPRAAAVSIQFQFASHELSDNGKKVLNEVGAALTDARLAEGNFVLEGHADAVGDDGANMSLSARRAETVRNFLISVWGLPAERVSALGRGETELLDPSNPESPRNRAVVIVNKGSVKN